MNISKLKGIGEQTSRRFARLGITDTDDLLLFYPRSYEIYDKPKLISEVHPGDIVAIHVMISDSPKMNARHRLQPMSVLVTDEAGNRMTASWYHSLYLSSQLKKGARMIFRGRLSFKGSMPMMAQPKIYSYEEYTNILRYESMRPIYRLTDGLRQSTVAKAVEQCFEGDLLPEEFLPDDLRNRHGLMDLRKALYAIHFPKNSEECDDARKRMVFDEFLLFSIGVRHNHESNRFDNTFRVSGSAYSRTVLENLDFSLTNAQKKVYEDIQKDFSGNFVANRLIQGDVGSGKTIVAFLAMLDMAYGGYQSVLMAPTEVLATQHYEKLQAMIEKNHLPLTVALLTGSVKESNKREIRDGLSAGRIHMLIGTHAVITDKVEYHNLGLVVTDEQHRFGVRQREALYNKGMNPHVLVMSATPIPRSLAVILYGDLDISVIDEKPAMRLPIKNCIVDDSYHPNAYRFITNEIHNGHQIYIICPMALENESAEDEDDGQELDNVVDYAADLKKVLEPGIRIAYLHGKMKPDEKSHIMDDFAAHKIDILVSTTVIEVGIDVPNATVMMVENAERFGLSTLHQLRGRVGRGGAQSYCIFFSDSRSEITKKRLQILKDSNDGFYIAECDLKMRGPGDILGTRQSGDLGFSIGDVYGDAAVLSIAAEEAKRLLNDDPELSNSEHSKLAERVNHYMSNRNLHMNI